MAIRVHLLAKEIGVTSKAILEKCRAEGLDVKNHMTVLSAGLEATIREWFSEGAHTTTEEKTERVNLAKIRSRRKKAVVSEEQPSATEEAEAQEESIIAEEVEAEEAEEQKVEAIPEVTPEEPEQPLVAFASAVAEAEPEAEEVTEVTPEAVKTIEVEEELTEEAKVSEAEAAEAVGGSEQPAAPSKAKPDILKPAARIELPEESKETPVAKGEAPVASEGEISSENAAAPVTPEVTEVVSPVGPMNVPAPAVMRGPRVVRMERPEVIPRPRPARVVEPRVPETEGPIRVAPKIGKKGREGVKEDETAKAKRAKSRTNPRRGRTGDPVEQLKEWRDRDLLERSQRLAQASDHPTAVSRAKPKKSKSSAPASVRQGKIQISEPIVLKEFCSAIGIPFSRLFPKLMAMGIPATINQGIATDQAELLALEFGIELDVQRQKSRYEELVEQFQNRKGNHPVRRSPIVTFLGHVDHGKTSLLDRIRHARVASGEAGGITQHIGAYRCPIEDRHVVFLDTPGHEAFTALRARGAQMTDIVVLVVAADDGVMPQTKEAISHAKAAGVPIVVALNKIDLPNADETKVLGQLSENGLIPAQWGGETDIIRTSAATGEGIDALVEHLSTLSDLLDMKGDPTGPATGVVIEARQDPNRGTVADIMIQEGTLKISDILVVGSAYGRVRAMFDDTGKSIQEAGPATPVEILGLDVIPDAGDHFYVTEDQKLAQAIAEEKRQENRSEYLLSRPKVTLENIFQQVEAGQVQHLNLIVKTDTQGSMDVLRSKLSEMGTDEVKVRILHTAVGGITEGDVILSEASDAIILGFGVVADDIARNKAQELDVEIRTYTVIYHLLEDITSAMEGLLEPTYEQKVMGRAVVREVFKVTRVGTVAGCMVTDGLIERSAKVRIIRQNVIVRENAQLDSLKRFKDDAREVRQGLECGIKLAGFDDIKEGDIIEAYQVIEVARKLQPAGND